MALGQEIATKHVRTIHVRNQREHHGFNQERIRAHTMIIASGYVRTAQVVRSKQTLNQAVQQVSAERQSLSTTSEKSLDLCSVYLRGGLQDALGTALQEAWVHVQT